MNTDPDQVDDLELGKDLPAVTWAEAFRPLFVGAGFAAFVVAVGYAVHLAG